MYSHNYVYILTECSWSEDGEDNSKLNHVYSNLIAAKRAFRALIANFRLCNITKDMIPDHDYCEMNNSNTDPNVKFSYYCNLMRPDAGSNEDDIIATENICISELEVSDVFSIEDLDNETIISE